MIAKHGIFDANWYLAAYPDLAAAGVDPLLHFLALGAAEGRDPNSLFDTSWYRASNPDVAATGENPLLHYLLHGAHEGRDPHPLFDTDWYLRSYPDVAAAGINPLAHYLTSGATERRHPSLLFDANWYLASNLDVAAAGEDPLKHYLRCGAYEGRDPHPLFDSDWYLAINPDVASIRSNPLVHFLTCGAHEGRDPHPLFDTDWYLRAYPDVAAAGINPLAHYLTSGATERRHPSPLFDANWYLASNPDVAAAGEDPLKHYLRYGAYEGRDPHPLFDSDWYLAMNPDVASTRSNPLVHFLTCGANEGRDPHPLFDTDWYLRAYPEVAAAGINPLAHYLTSGATERRPPTPLFDANWYLASNPDVAATGEDPLKHYLRCGAYEGRDPHPLFDSDWYLAMNPDVASTRSNPLVHFLTCGAHEGRDPHPLFDSDWYLAMNPDVASTRSNPLVHFLTYGANEGRDPHPLFDSDWYLAMNPDVESIRPNPLVHFLTCGANEGRDPHPLFNLNFYRAQVPGLDPRQNPLVHFLTTGERDGLRPNPEYEARDIAQILRARRITGDRSKFKTFVQISNNETRKSVRDNVDAGRPTWIVPHDFRIEIQDGVFRRTLEVSAGRYHLMQHWPIDQASASFVIPFVAPGSEIRSIAIGTRGYLDPGCIILGVLSKTPSGPALIDGFFRYDSVQRRIVWDLAGGVLGPGRRYFIRLETNQISGLSLTAVVFDQVISQHRHQLNIAVDTTAALPSLWQRKVDRKPEMTILMDGETFDLDSNMGQLCAVGHRQYPDYDFNVVNSTHAHTDAIAIVSRSQLICLDATLCGKHALGMPTLDLIRLLRIHGTRVFLLDGQNANAPKPASVAQALNYCAGMRQLTARASKRGTAVTYEIVSVGADSSEKTPPANLGLPTVAIVAVLQSRTDTISQCLRAIFRQNYPGKIVVIFVDDGTPAPVAEDILASIDMMMLEKPSHVEIQLLRSDEALGVCASRNAALAACQSDIFAVIDADCIVNGRFVAAHVSEHLLRNGCAVVGQPSIDAAGESPHSLLLQLENDPAAVRTRASPPDPLFAAAFVNALTSSVSFNSRWLIEQGGFDPKFSCAGRLCSSFGFENIDLTARIYAGGGTIQFTPHAFSVRVAQHEAAPEAKEIQGLATDLARLTTKHEFVRDAARRWYLNSADRIAELGRNGNVASAELEQLRADVTGKKAYLAPILPYMRRKGRRYRILTHRWHVPHQYEIYKLPFEFTLVTHTGTGFTNYWSNDQRPLPPNVRMARMEDLNPSDFDMAIVHFDENVLCTDLSSVLSPDWGTTFRWFINNIDLPMVGVCHGTMPFVGQYAANPNEIPVFELYDNDGEYLRRTLDKIEVVVNSHEAAREWQFNRMRVIWHGYDPQEFLPGRHDLDVVSHGLDRHRPHYRGMHALQSALNRLSDELKVSDHKHVSHVPVPSTDPRYSRFSFANWLEHLGRHKIYLNTTLRSPMPRSRTEAMLCGVIPVSLDNHDVSNFIRNGVDGFYSSSVEELADFCEFVCSNPATQRGMSNAARATAMNLFNHDRFLGEWTALIKDTVG